MQRIEKKIRSYINDRNRVRNAITGYLRNVLNSSKGDCITITTAKIMNEYQLQRRDLPLLRLMLWDFMVKVGTTARKSKRNVYRYVICGEDINKLEAALNDKGNT